MNRFRVSALVPFAGVLIGVVAAIQTILAVQFGLHPDTNPNDFYYFYKSAQEIRLGGDWYAGTTRILSLNAPAIALLYRPFAGLPYPVAYLTWTALSLAALVGMCVRVATASVHAQPFWLVVLALTTITGMMNVAMGQVGFPLAWLVAEAWLADRQDRPFVAGLAIGVAVYAKVFLGLFIVYLMWRRAWRSVAAAAVGFLLMVVAGLAAGGWQVHLSWLRALNGITWLENPLNASITGVLMRTFQSSPWWTTAPLDAVVLAAVAWGIWRAEHIDRSWVLLLFGSLLLSPLGWMYYIPMAMGPLVALWDRGTPMTRTLIVIGTLLLCVHPPDPGSPAYNFTLGSVYAWAVVVFLLIGLVGTDESYTAQRLPARQHV